MRLTPQQVSSLISAITPFIQQKQIELRLYGSRIHDHLKGGDIDLLLITQEEIVANKLREEKHLLLAQIKKYLGEQKIDLTITTSQEINNDPFLKLILPESFVLHTWNKNS